MELIDRPVDELTAEELEAAQDEMARLAPIHEGDRVEVLPPHGEAGARGVVEKIYPANRDYRRRAKVRFAEPYGVGASTISADMLRPI